MRTKPRVLRFYPNLRASRKVTNLPLKRSFQTLASEGLLQQPQRFVKGILARAKLRDLMPKLLRTPSRGPHSQYYGEKRLK